MRQRLSLFACLLLLFVLVACGGGSSTPPSAAKSTISATPKTVPAGGQAQANITVTLRDSQGQPIGHSLAAVNIKVNPCHNCDLKYTDDNGTITGALSSKVAETITLSFSVNGVTSPNTATVDFVAGPATKR